MPDIQGKHSRSTLTHNTGVLPRWKLSFLFPGKQRRVELSQLTSVCHFWNEETSSQPSAIVWGTNFAIKLGNNVAGCHRLWGPSGSEFENLWNRIREKWEEIEFSVLKKFKTLFKIFININWGFIMSLQKNLFNNFRNKGISFP